MVIARVSGGFPQKGRVLVHRLQDAGEDEKELDILAKETETAAAMEEGEVQARFYHDTVFPAMEALRAPVDQLEMIVDKEAWPMPSYGDLMFEV